MDSNNVADAGDEVLVTVGCNTGKRGRVIYAYQPLSENGSKKEWKATVQLLDHDALITAPISALSVLRKVSV